MRTTIFTDALPPLSVIALGTAEFGSRIADDAAYALLDAYAAGGGNVLDTAHCYAAWLPDGDGASERLLGRWLRDRGNRSRMVISTKGGHPPMSAMDKPRLRPADIAFDLGQSLERLGLPSADLYWVHRDDPTIPAGEIIDALEEHRRGGRIRAYGASNWTTARLDDAAAHARSRGFPGFCADQPGWSLAERRTDVPPVPGCLYAGSELLAWHNRTRLPTMAYTSQARGWFAKDVGDYDTPANRARRDRARALAAQLGSNANRVALAWLTSQAFPGVAVVGPHQADQLADCLAAGELLLTADQAAALNG